MYHIVNTWSDSICRLSAGFRSLICIASRILKSSLELVFPIILKLSNVRPWPLDSVWSLMLELCLTFLSKPVLSDTPICCDTRVWRLAVVLPMYCWLQSHVYRYVTHDFNILGSLSLKENRFWSLSLLVATSLNSAWGNELCSNLFNFFSISLFSGP